MLTELQTSFGAAQYNNGSNLATVYPASSDDFRYKGNCDYSTHTIITNQQQRETKKMSTTPKRGLYQVILIDPKAGKIIFNEMAISSKPEDVLLEVDAGKVIRDNKLEVSDVDKIINFIGEVRKTRKNKDGVVEIAVDDKE